MQPPSSRGGFGPTVVLLLFAPDVYRGELATHAVVNVGPVAGRQLGITFTADALGLTYALLSAALGGLVLLYSRSELGGLTWSLRP